jgi:hypothetical protein
MIYVLLSVLWLPFFVGCFFLAWRLKRIALTMFCILTLVSHGINPYFFWANREVYDQFGWAAVGLFDWTVVSFLNAYLPLLLLVIWIIFSFLAWDIIVLRTKVRLALSLSQVLPSIEPSRRATRQVCCIIVFATILSSWMFSARIGLTGVMPPTLPFKLVGLMFYTQRFLIPLVLCVLYWRSTRPWWLYIVLLAYATWAGMASISRAALMLSAAPIIAITALEHRYGRLTLGLVGLAVAWFLVLAVRNVVYVDPYEPLSLIAVASVILPAVELPWSVVWELIFHLSDRLYGAQTVILASQYTVPDPLGSLQAIAQGRAPLPDMAWSLYHLDFGDKAFGVGLGLLSSVLLTTHESPLFFLAGWGIGMALLACEMMLRTAIQHRQALPGLMLGIALVFVLYDGRCDLFMWGLAGSVLWLWLQPWQYWLALKRAIR